MIQMLPFLSSDNRRYGRLANTETSCQYCLEFSFCVSFAYVYCLLLCQFGPPSMFSIWLPLLCVPIIGVVSVGSWKEMFRITAVSNIATVKCQQWGKVFSGNQKQCDAMRFEGPSVGDRKSPIPAPVGVCFPRPTLVWTFSVNLFPKTFNCAFRNCGKWFSMVGSHTVCSLGHLVRSFRSVATAPVDRFMLSPLKVTA